MRILLDTHILLWWLSDDPRLPGSIRAAVADGGNSVYVSAISVAEIAIESSLGKLESPGDLAAASMRPDCHTYLSRPNPRTTCARLSGTIAIPSTAC